mmetsp:Transcript_17473/g.25974  ORF Transcript_17473/g.25974 Transcript_17473/m.25974 type:complete len:106 (-) Transcript_17473:57-374(-)
MRYMKCVVAVIALVSAVLNHGRESVAHSNPTFMREVSLLGFVSEEPLRRLLTFAEEIRGQGFVHLWRLKIVAQKARAAISISSRYGRVRTMVMHVKQMRSVADHV